MPAIPQPRVLFVDDDEDSREMLSELLKFWQIETKGVGTAAGALSSIREERFDLYLLDAWLPDLDGFELCRRMRDADPNTPILFFSGAAYASDKEKGIEAGATAYLVKPDIEGLRECLTQCFLSAATRQPPLWADGQMALPASTPILTNSGWIPPSNLTEQSCVREGGSSQAVDNEVSELAQQSFATHM